MAEVTVSMMLVQEKISGVEMVFGLIEVNCVDIGRACNYQEAKGHSL